MDTQKSLNRTDLDLLNRLQPLSSLSAVALRELASGFNSVNFARRAVILPEEASAANVHILLRGVAKITCLNRCDRRVTVAFLAPSPLPDFFSLPVNRWRFRCEAHSDCRVASVSWDRFDAISKTAPRFALERFHENDLMQWYRFFDRGFSLLLGLDLRERLLSTLLQLCSTFGVMESRGTLLRVSFSHKDLADMVGASRPRVTEHLADLEREHLLIRQGRQMIVRVDRIENSTSLALPDATGSRAKAGTPAHFPEAGELCGPRSLAALGALKPPPRKNPLREQRVP